MRKIAASALLILGLSGGLIMGQGLASASTSDGIRATYAGVYPNKETCEREGCAGQNQGRWWFEHCHEMDGYGQYGLYVVPRL